MRNTWLDRCAGCDRPLWGLCACAYRVEARPIDRKAEASGIADRINAEADARLKELVF
jgi:hypothetical protein